MKNVPESRHWRAAAVALLAVTSTAAAEAAPCLKVTLTGTQGGPPVYKGQAGAGTLVGFGDESNGCSSILLQFDAGRGTTQQLSKIGVSVAKINAVFLTHVHSDHSEGLGDVMQLRWHFFSKGPDVDLVCSDDAKSPLGHVLSCRKLATHIGDALKNSGEIAQRLSESKVRRPGGPSDLLAVKTFTPSNTPANVWSSGDVSVRAVRSTHIAGHASYRVDTPAGSVVIGGDAGNDTPMPPRTSSTSEQVETLAKGADILVHSTIHPVMGPDKGTGFPPPIYHRQSTAFDLGSLAKRAGVKHLMLTHLIPAIGAARQGVYPIPGGGLKVEDYKQAAAESGYGGNIVVGQDLETITLTKK